MRPQLPKIDSMIRKLGFENVALQLQALLEETLQNDTARGTSGRSIDEQLALKRSILRLQDSIEEFKKS